VSAHLSASSIKAQARHLGFDLCGIAPATDLPELRFFERWLASGYAGEMNYLHRTADRRADVRRLLPSAQTVIVTGTLYNTDRPYSTESRDAGRAQIARYAWGADYHDVIGDRLDALLEWMRGVAAEPFDALRYVDTGPIQERVYAQHAGLGWIGKNTCVINAALGSWLLLGEIVCSLPLEVDAPAFDQCGTCTLCIEACPTDAIRGAGVLDSTRCLSYLTIERRGPIPDGFLALIGSHVYGCDVCQEVCPWNQHAPNSTDPAWQPREAWDNVSILTLEGKTDDELREAMRGSAMRRATVAGLRRNVNAARKNSGAAD
jgi:epoxyqueuosine reductase